eukprot:CAMPEP_0170128668 /NCGR_PEP_ID=MMETSP0020_2-20130122/21317_1 /TAXON_ID=98059 /ORGANISM="Dinobryon sp., Strain UTEXLB2267" /LENGTH=159 /DNA_ID=CAMNT_0010362651 /DNA_START=116 /DNA_END=592 /DNA_ORIENTATION=-
MKVPIPIPPYRTAPQPDTAADTASLPSAKSPEDGQQYFFSDKFKLGQLGVAGSNKASASAPSVDAASRPNSNPLNSSTSQGDTSELEYGKPFQFLNLGVLAYIGASEALAQISIGDINTIKGSGNVLASSYGEASIGSNRCRGVIGSVWGWIGSRPNCL